MNGELIPYQIQADDAITLALLLGLLFVAHAIFFLGRPFLRKLEQLPLFALRQKDWLAVSSSAPVLTFLLLNAWIVIGLLVLFLSLARYPALLQISLPTGVLLLVYMGTMVVYIGMHGLLYRFVGWVFFEPEQVRLGFQGWVYSVALVGLLNLPLLLGYAYFDISLQALNNSLFLILILICFLLFFWLRKIFSVKFYGSLLLFSYLCALEIIPMILMVLGIEMINGNLISNY